MSGSKDDDPSAAGNHSNGGDSGDEAQDREQKPYKVGYKKPPRHTQFKKGHKPVRRKQKERTLDIDDTLDKPVTVMVNGQRVTRQPYEVALLSQIKKALAQDLTALGYVLEQFERYGILSARVPEKVDRVVVLPSTMPFPMAKIMVQAFGTPPWTKAQLVKGREQYVAARSDQQQREDEAIGYPDL